MTSLSKSCVEEHHYAKPEHQAQGGRRFVTILASLWNDFMRHHENHRARAKSEGNGIAQSESTGDAQPDHRAYRLHQARAHP